MAKASDPASFEIRIMEPGCGGDKEAIDTRRLLASKPARPTCRRQPKVGEARGWEKGHAAKQMKNVMHANGWISPALVSKVGTFETEFRIFMPQDENPAVLLGVLRHCDAMLY